jgi:hypothetical protein
VLLHEASIIATKERAEMKKIEFFIARKLSLTTLDIQSQNAVSGKACRIRSWHMRRINYQSPIVGDSRGRSTPNPFIHQWKLLGMI